MEQNRRNIIYANQIQVQMQLFDFSLTLNTVDPDGIHQEQGVLYLSPQHAKALLQVLSDNVNMYESLFGPINLETDEKQLEMLSSQGRIQIAAGKEQ